MVKYANKTSVSRFEATRRVLFLAYGTEEPSVTDPPPRLLPLPVVAELMHVKPRFVSYLHGLYFNQVDQALKRLSLQPPKLNARPSEGAKVTLQNIRDEEIEFLTSSETLRAWAPYSLQWRCTLFHRRYPDRWLAPWTLSQLYRNAGIKKKSILTRRAPQRKTQRLEEFEDKVLQLHRQVQEIQAAEGHLVFIDESTFTARAYQQRAWAQECDNVLVEDRTGKQPCLAVCAAVCACHGLLTFEVEEDSFDAPKFIHFLEGLRGAVGKEKVYVLLDNCRVHHAKLTQPYWERLNFEPVWNVAYMPEYNAAVERYWGQLKATFRPLLL